MNGGLVGFGIDVCGVESHALWSSWALVQVSRNHITCRKDIGDFLGACRLDVVFELDPYFQTGISLLMHVYATYAGCQFVTSVHGAEQK